MGPGIPLVAEGITSGNIIQQGNSFFFSMQAEKFLKGDFKISGISA